MLPGANHALLTLAFSATLFLFLHFMRVITFAFAIEEQPLGWRIVTRAPETWTRGDKGTWCPPLNPVVELGAPDAQGFVPVTVRDVKLCTPWEAKQVLARLAWLPDASGELENYFARAKRERPNSWQAIGVAPHDSLKHAQVITFLDAALEAGVEGLVFVDFADHSAWPSE